MNIGIDKISFFTSDLYLPMEDLAKARNEDPNKYLIGIGQSKQAVIRNSQDAVTLAANAAWQILDEKERQSIDLILFGTESGVDNSKSAAVYLQSLLGINSQASGIELKQACFGLTAGIQLAMGHIALHPQSRVLLVGADIARYGIKTAGEPTQGGGAVAMIMSANPRILKINPESAHLTKDIMDFWRPLYRSEALVDGHYSSQEFIDFFQSTFQQYSAKTGQGLNDFAALIFHLPYTKMGLKALRSVLEEAPDDQIAEGLLARFEDSRQLNREVGNLYTGSLYLSLLSLLQAHSLREGDQIGLFSYGSGAEGEFYTGEVVQGYEKMLDTNVSKQLRQRKPVSVTEYEEIYRGFMAAQPSDFVTDYQNDPARFVLKGQKDQQRQYVERKD
ncbi:hydroxymethylglutaryl-CoA synthase [Pediococcus acidilactici]|uniref:hydroxymethylglutaryl-CoA synthase n=1 Tax=Pediococcus acidilactici TaxID=1254 RepID=UPI0011083764|nr:hydroxymethylglutaryl-CoA synthase [Pediococcus acidilactici]KAF0344708.1 hydroxymethylglutaryl-CoA synthase [Pediococcus acidilactici]TLQ01732.1 hydroxymethylglutaryl-CoA synthase [Pediococcus acidilactici]